MNTSASALLALSQKLSHDIEKTVLDDVSLALEQPHGYFEKYEERLSERGIEEPLAQLAWFALVDVLIDHLLAFEIDWKASGLYVCDVVDELMDRKQMQLLDWEEFEDGDFNDLEPEECLEQVAKKLREVNVSLAYLDIESDCYVLITVPTAEIAEIKRLAQEAGYIIKDTFSSDPE